MALTKVTYSMIDGPCVNINDYGADSTGTDDSTTQIQAAADAAAAAGAKLIGFGTYKITAKVIIKGDADLSQCDFNVSGAPAVAVEISTGNASDPTTLLANVNVILPRTIVNLDKPTTGWVGQGIGVRTVNLRGSRIVVNDIINFATNFYFTANGGQGASYNTMTIGRLINGKFDLLISPLDSTSWVNENLWIGGEYSHYTAEGTNVTGVRCINIQPFDYSNATTPWPNQNIFLKPTVEGAVAQFAVELSGSYNSFISPRWENNEKLYIHGDTAGVGKTTYNSISDGYGTSSLVITTYGTVLNPISIFNAGTNAIAASNTVMNIKNSTSATESGPHLQGFAPSVEPAGKDNTATDWSYRLYANGLSGKATADSYEKWYIDWHSTRAYMYWGDGTAAPTVFWSSGAGTPEGNLVGSPGSLYTRTNGGAGTTLYVKETGTGNTGWVAK